MDGEDGGAGHDALEVRGLGVRVGAVVLVSLVGLGGRGFDSAEELAAEIAKGLGVALVGVVHTRVERVVHGGIGRKDGALIERGVRRGEERRAHAVRPNGTRGRGYGAGDAVFAGDVEDLAAQGEAVDSAGKALGRAVVGALLGGNLDEAKVAEHGKGLVDVPVLEGDDFGLRGSSRGAGADAGDLTVGDGNGKRLARGLGGGDGVLVRGHVEEHLCDAGEDDRGNLGGPLGGDLGEARVGLDRPVVVLDQLKGRLELRDAVDPDLHGGGADAERVRVPEGHVGVETGLYLAEALAETEEVGGCGRDAGEGGVIGETPVVALGRLEEDVLRVEDGVVGDEDGCETLVVEVLASKLGADIRFSLVEHVVGKDGRGRRATTPGALEDL